MKFSRHVNFAIFRFSYFATAKFRDFAKISLFSVKTIFFFAILCEHNKIYTFPTDNFINISAIDFGAFIYLSTERVTLPPLITGKDLVFFLDRATSPLVTGEFLVSSLYRQRYLAVDQRRIYGAFLYTDTVTELPLRWSFSGRVWNVIHNIYGNHHRVHPPHGEPPHSNHHGVHLPYCEPPPHSAPEPPHGEPTKQWTSTQLTL